MSKHGPNSWSRYVEIHETAMARWRDDGFVIEDNLEWFPFAGGFRLAGYIACLGRLSIKATKTLYIVGGARSSPLVETRSYAYNASVADYGEVLRYDNARHPIAGAADRHHRHSFSWRTGTEIEGSPRWVGVDRWPTLGDFIAEVQQWHWDNWEDVSREFDPRSRAPLQEVLAFEKGRDE